MTARLLAVSVAHHVKPDPGNSSGLTGIDKRPVDGPVAVRTLGLAGDRVMDPEHHGGRDKAVYVYAREDQQRWAGELGRDLAPGGFGENLTTEGLDVTGARIGERWQVGAVTLEVTMPRQPCATFQRHLGEPHWVKRFTAAGAPGAYCRVLVEGEVAAGDPVRILHRPAYGVSVGELLRPDGVDPGRLERLLAEPDLAPALVTAVRRRLAAGRAPAGPPAGPAGSPPGPARSATMAG